MPAQIFGRVEPLAEWHPAAQAVDDLPPAPHIDFLSAQDGIGFEPDLKQNRGRLPFGLLDNAPAGHAAAPAGRKAGRWIPDRMWAIPGPYTGLGPRGYRRSDRRIFEDICDRLTRHGLLDASELEVIVDDGLVTLYGAVTGQAESRMAAATAGGVPGVVAIVNRLQLKG